MNGKIKGKIFILFKKNFKLLKKWLTDYEIINLFFQSILCLNVYFQYYFEYFEYFLTINLTNI